MSHHGVLYHDGRLLRREVLRQDVGDVVNEDIGIEELDEGQETVGGEVVAELIDGMGDQIHWGQIAKGFRRRSGHQRRRGQIHDEGMRRGARELIDV